MKKEVNGNLKGIRDYTLSQMAELYDLVFPKDEFITRESVEALESFTKQLGREVALMVSRDGRVQDVSIGDDHSAQIASLKLTRSDKRLSGVRCIHTHPSGHAGLSTTDLATLQSSRLDAMCSIAVGDEQEPALITAAYLDERISSTEWVIRQIGPMPFDEIDQYVWINAITVAEQISLRDDSQEKNEQNQERALLIGLETGFEVYDSLDELALLAQTAGAYVIGKQTQKRDKPDNATYVGRGKLQEILRIGNDKQIDLFIFDDELSSIQIRNLESILGNRVIDRTALILDIFANRAQSREGKLQVELAQLKYRLPRLSGLGGSMSRLRNGIGMRGPGEKKLEVDRRRIKRQIFELENEIDTIKKQRALRRERREKTNTPQIALVGYTNAGKSSLLNCLAESDVLAADMLFATLDPVVRQTVFSNAGNVLISDTVGFINKLPHDLIDAFRSTLEEVENADLILHVVDVSFPYYREQMKVVDDVLAELDVEKIPMITVFNKIDAVDDVFLENLSTPDNAVFISARTGAGVDELIAKCEKIIMTDRCIVSFTLSYEQQDVAAYLRNHAHIIEETYEDNGMVIKTQIDTATHGAVQKMLGEVPLNTETELWT